MRKLLLVMLFMLLLTGCSSDSDDVETPDGADIATCTAGQVFKYIYQDDVVYEFYTDDVLTELLQRLKSKMPDARITLSLGERSKESYQKIKDAGADRYLLRHETAS